MRPNDLVRSRENSIDYDGDLAREALGEFSAVQCSEVQRKTMCCLAFKMAN